MINQQDLEAYQLRQGREQALGRLSMLQAVGASAVETAGGRALTHGLVDCLKHLQPTDEGMQNVYSFLDTHMDRAVWAVVAARAFVDATAPAKAPTITSAYRDIGWYAAIEATCAIIGSEKDLFKRLRALVSCRKKKAERAEKVDSLIRALLLKNDISISEWTPAIRESVGRAVCRVAEAAGLCHISKARTDRVPHVYRSDEYNLMYDKAAARTVSQAVHRTPFVCIPKDYTDTTFSGGRHYEQPEGLIIGDRSDTDLAPLVAAAVNKVQHVAWRVNQQVLELALECATRPDCCPLVTPIDRHTDYQGYMKTRRQVGQERNILASADTFKGAPIWYPYRLDYRGRMYAAGGSLNPQGTDLAKGLLRFDQEGRKPCEEGMHAWVRHGLNKWGTPSLNPEQTLKTYDELQPVFDTFKRDPLGTRHLWGTEAKQPWQFIAWLLDDTYSVPIQVDGTCNGLQHLAALCRDTEVAHAVNMLPEDEPQDIYNNVAQSAKALIIAGTYREGLQYINKIDRDRAKPVVMPLPYGITKYSALGAVYASFDEERNETTKAVGNALWHAATSCTKPERDLMEWVVVVCQDTIERNEWPQWQAPDGFVTKLRPKRDTYHNVAIASGQVYRPLDRSMDPARTARAAAPNLIHSLDSAHCRAILREAPFAVSPIHDCFACLPYHMPELAQIIRKEFINLHRDRILEQLVQHNHSTVPLPILGDLCINSVQQNRYFFS